jgi:hypothetical protein
MITPYWAGRNKLIADEFLQPNKSILDLGCGSKNLLKFYSPIKYLGVDGIGEADIIVDLNSNFILPSGWDYAVNSGILEYLNNIEKYFVNIRGLATEFVFTWWTGTGYGRMSHSQIETLISKYFCITHEKYWSPVQKVYKCFKI